MLKFIGTGKSRKGDETYFKTSYVEVYRNMTDMEILFTIISKHLMLKFITGTKYHTAGCRTYFKTSYVEVYPTFSRYFYLFSPSFFLISIIFTKHQPIFFFLSNISQIPRLYNTFSTFFFFSPGKYFYNSQSGMGCSSDIFTTENA